MARRRKRQDFKLYEEAELGVEAPVKKLMTKVQKVKVKKLELEYDYDTDEEQLEAAKKLHRKELCEAVKVYVGKDATANHAFNRTGQTYINNLREELYEDPSEEAMQLKCTPFRVPSKDAADEPPKSTKEDPRDQIRQGVDQASQATADAVQVHAEQ